MALCGPSNAVQNLQKHVAVDRTLQQDRLVSSRPGPSQSFRTQPTNAGPSRFDLEFEQFSGIPTAQHLQRPLHHSPSAVHLTHPHTAPLRHAHSQGFQRPSPAPQPALSNWAADFQKLSLGAPGPSAVNARQTQAAPRTVGGWEQDFFAFNSLGSDVQAHQARRQASMNFGGMYSSSGTSTMSGTYALGSGIMGAPVAAETLETGKGKEVVREQEAFDKAFDQAMMDAASQHDVLDELDATREEPIVDAPLQIVEEPVAERQEEERDPQAENDELARTAGQLLESVQSDQSQKFKDSKFLALMRKLRDKEVKVEGDKVVENVAPMGGSNESSKGKEGSREGVDPGAYVWGDAAYQTY